MINSNTTIHNSLCVGSDCANSESYGFDTIRLKENNLRIHFDDTSAAAGGFADQDWRIEVNSSANGGDEYFRVIDATANRDIFTLEANAPSNSLVVSSQGNIGSGTANPATDIHSVSGDTPTLRLEQDGSSGFGAQTWDVAGNETNFFIRDVTNGSALPFRIRPGASSNSLFIDDDGDISMGAAAPEGKLHTKGDGVQLAYFESGDGGPVQVRFRTDSENRRFLAVNNANEVKSQLIFLDDRINFTGETDSGANLWLSVGPDGIVSQGPTCNPGPCDAVFDPEVFEVPDIEARAAQMWAQKHLPAIGPTKPHAPINLTEKMGGVIHELEVAHIYIAEQHETIKEMGSNIETLKARVIHLEDRLSD
ncbi:hypothetical protein DZK27_13895 [Rhodobacteraceae bacterium 63075]|nr:hypothetical protein DZK27_13895 [Rhodobacteraceae bacterium 63075]